jgi:lysophospholipase L1-like esterase
LGIFNGLEYIASYADLIAVFGADKAAGQRHYDAIGRLEGRVASFDALAYKASYRDLSAAFGADEDAEATHYILHGRAEGRSVAFDGLAYIASYDDLIAAFGANPDAGSAHYITNGRAEGRTVSFDGLEYIASHADLIAAFGADEGAGSAHYITYGADEGRDQDGFSAYQYLQNYADLRAAFGSNVEAATRHYIEHGFEEGRDDTAAAWAGGLRILPLGDSITRGVTGDPSGQGYRGPLHELFDDADLTVDFVDQFQNGSFADPDHQGVSGRTATELDTLVTGIVNAQDPEAVLLLIGTNDVRNEPNPAGTLPGEIVSIVNKIHAADDPSTYVLVATVPALAPAEIAPSLLAATNAAVAEAVNALEAQGRAVSLVDTGAIGQADLFDGVHPNPAGYDKLAGIWFEAVLDALPPPDSAGGAAVASAAGGHDLLTAGPDLAGSAAASDFIVGT